MLYETCLTESCKIPIYSNGMENEGLYGYTNKPRVTEPSITISARGTIGFCCVRETPYCSNCKALLQLLHLRKLIYGLFKNSILNH